jgi:peptidyl-prolyl cis-trans isomerase B (cyclophilin B)
VPRPIPTLLTCVALGALAAGCGGGGSGAGSTAKSTTAGDGAVTAGAKLPAGCTRVQDPGDRADEANQKRPRGRLTSDAATVEMQTNCGSFTISLAVGDAPRTASSFATLVKRGFYDGLTFHRISGDPTGGPFVIQGGDPLGTGLGGPGYSVREKPPAGTKYTKYTVAMAKTASEPAGTSGSQFFVVTGEDAGLPPDYALLGKVTKGQEVVDKIGVLAVGPDEAPTEPVVIRNIRITTS